MIEYIPVLSFSFGDRYCGRCANTCGQPAIVHLWRASERETWMGKFNGFKASIKCNYVQHKHPFMYSRKEYTVLEDPPQSLEERKVLLMVQDKPKCGYWLWTRTHFLGSHNGR